VLDVVPAHVADHLEAIRQDFPDGGLAVHAPPIRLGAARHEKRRVVVEEAQDPVHVPGVEGGVDVQEEVDARAGCGRGHDVAISCGEGALFFIG